MKKLSLILTAAALLFSLCGCYDYVDIEQNAMIAGFAVDLSEKGYKITAEIISSPTSGAEAEIQPKIASSEGETISGCLRNMISESSKKIDFSHCKIIFISKDAAEKGIHPVLDLIFHNDQIKLSIDLAVIKEGEAAEIFKQEPLLASIVSYEAQETIETMEKYLSVSPRGMSYKTLNRIASIGTEAVLPVFTVKEKSFLLEGCCFFKEDKLAGFLNDEEGRLLQMICGDFNQGMPTFTIKKTDGKDETCSLSPEFISYSGQSKPSKDNPYEIQVAGKIQLRLDEIPEGISIETEQGRKSLEDSVKQETEDKIKKFTEKMLREEKCDIFGFGRQIYHQDVRKKGEIESDEYFEKISVSAELTVRIEGSGTSQKSLRE